MLEKGQGRTKLTLSQGILQKCQGILGIGLMSGNFTKTIFSIPLALLPYFKS